jgi:hypothetical protein
MLTLAHLGEHFASIIDALKADRTDVAIDVLAEIACTARIEAALLAVEALARINTARARYQLAQAALSESASDRVKEKAAELLEHLLD